MKGPQRLRALAARARAVVQIRPEPLEHPTPAEPDRITPPAAQALNEQAPRNTAAEPLFNDPPIFPYDINIGQDTATESPYNLTSATLHIGDTVIDAVWQLTPPKTDPDRTVLGIDGDTIVKATIAENGTYTVTTLPSTPPPRRRGGQPNNCPCTAIYSECQCPVRR